MPIETNRAFRRWQAATQKEKAQRRSRLQPQTAPVTVDGERKEDEEAQGVDATAVVEKFTAPLRAPGQHKVVIIPIFRKVVRQADGQRAKISHVLMGMSAASMTIGLSFISGEVERSQDLLTAGLANLREQSGVHLSRESVEQTAEVVSPDANVHYLILNCRGFGELLYEASADMQVLLSVPVNTFRARSVVHQGIAIGSADLAMARLFFLDGYRDQNKIERIFSEVMEYDSDIRVLIEKLLKVICPRYLCADVYRENLIAVLSSPSVKVLSQYEQLKLLEYLLSRGEVACLQAFLMNVSLVGVINFASVTYQYGARRYIDDRKVDYHKHGDLGELVSYCLLHCGTALFDALFVRGWGDHPQFSNRKRRDLLINFLRKCVQYDRDDLIVAITKVDGNLQDRKLVVKQVIDVLMQHSRFDLAWHVFHKNKSLIDIAARHEILHFLSTHSFYSHLGFDKELIANHIVSDEVAEELESLSRFMRLYPSFSAFMLHTRGYEVASVRFGDNGVYYAGRIVDEEKYQQAVARDPEQIRERECFVTQEGFRCMLRHQTEAFGFFESRRVAEFVFHEAKRGVFWEANNSVTRAICSAVLNKHFTLTISMADGGVTDLLQAAQNDDFKVALKSFNFLEVRASSDAPIEAYQSLIEVLKQFPKLKLRLSNVPDAIKDELMSVLKRLHSQDEVVNARIEQGVQMLSQLFKQHVERPQNVALGLNYDS